jgi:NhaP-type Na+/H+ or K+/H+ antiporter
MEPITFLTYLTIILIAGIICTLLSTRLRVSNILLLIIAGVILGNIEYRGDFLIQFPQMFLTSIGIFALVLIVFDSSSKFKLREFTGCSLQALKLASVFLFLNAIFLTIFTLKLYSVSIFVALIFAALMSGTAPDAIMVMLGKRKSDIFELLKVESLLNTPLIVLIPFILIDFMASFEVRLIFSKFIEQVGPFLQQFITGIGSGIVIGIIVLRLMKKKYSETISPLAIITSALLAYILAENLGGNGVLAVTTMGLFFGNVYLAHKVQLREMASFFANSLEILVFILVGLIVRIPFDLTFILKSILLFALYLGIRYAAVAWSYKGYCFNFKEKLFMTFNAQKGIAVAVVTFSLSTLHIDGLDVVLHLVLLFMLYSIILSTIAVKFTTYFVKNGKKG